MANALESAVLPLPALPSKRIETSGVRELVLTYRERREDNEILTLVGKEI